MGKKPVQTEPKDPFLLKIEDWVKSVIDDPKASFRSKATAAQIGLKARQTRHVTGGDSDEGEFFG